MTPEMKTDRPKLLASTLIKELTQGRINQIRATKLADTPKPAFRPSATARELQRAYIREVKRSKVIRARLERAILKNGVAIYTHSPYQLHSTVPDSDTIRRNRHRQSIDHRIAAAQVARTEALIELLVVPPAKIKAFVVTFQKALAAL